MKKIIVALALGVLIAGNSFAQTAPHQERKYRTEHHDGRGKRDRKSPEERAKYKTERISKQLDLSKSQTKRLMALNLKQAQEMTTMRANHQRGDKFSPQQHEQMKALRERWNAELKDILTKKQYAQYQKQRQEMRAQRQDRDQHRARERAQKYNG